MRHWNYYGFDLLPKIHVYFRTYHWNDTNFSDQNRIEKSRSGYCAHNAEWAKNIEASDTLPTSTSYKFFLAPLWRRPFLICRQSGHGFHPFREPSLKNICPGEGLGSATPFDLQPGLFLPINSVWAKQAILCWRERRLSPPKLITFINLSHFLLSISVIICSVSTF